MEFGRRGATCWQSGLVAVVMTLALLCGCAQDQPGTASPSTRSTPIPAPSPIPIADFCASDVPAGLTQAQVGAGAGTRINVAEVGSGRTAAVLLHQTDGNGLCGFLFYAAYLAERGVKAVTMDLCGYGQSVCADVAISNDPAAQVKAVTDAVRGDGATRVVLVGASMGGTTAVHAAKATRADAIVDLSGPAEFNGMTVSADAANVTMPALFAFSRVDRSDLNAVHRQLNAMPTKDKTFLTFDVGHGYELLHEQKSMTDLTPLAGRVLKLIKDGS